MPDDRHGHALTLLEDRGKEIGGLDGLASRAARLMESQLEHQFGRRRDTKLAAGKRR
jgi:hypothetical protein